MSNETDIQRLILEQLREFKTDVNRRFEQQELAIRELKEDMRQGFDHVGKRLDRIETDVRADRDKLQQVYESRERVSVNFTRTWTFASVFIALFASTVVLAFAKAF